VYALGVPFATTLWRAIEPIYAAILAHPFVRGLTDGSLPREAFRFYAVQDALYLRDFARALVAGAARSPRGLDHHVHRARGGALKVEKTLHGPSSDFGFPRGGPATPLAPTNLAYTSYLLAPHAGPSRGGGRAPALLLDLLGGRRDPRARGCATALRALDRHLRLRGVRCGGAHVSPAPTRSPRACATTSARHAAPLRHHEPLRVDVLGHGWRQRPGRSSALPSSGEGQE
jgi:hypothetical protein